MASITKVVGGYRAQIYVKGTRDTKTFRTQREANAWGAARETELRSLAKMPLGDKHTLNDALIKFEKEVTPLHLGSREESIRIKAHQADKFLPTKIPLSKLTTDHFIDWRDQRLLTVAGSTVLREIALLNTIIEEARTQWKWLDTNPLTDLRRPRAPKHREVIITRQQIKGVLSAMGYKPRAKVATVSGAVAVAFLLALRIGLREGEIAAGDKKAMGLRWDNVFADHVHVGSKTEAGERDVPINKKSIRLINKMRGFDPVYVIGVGPKSIDAMFRKYRKRAGLEGFTFHDTRHYAATKLANKVNVLTLCKIFGWTNPKMAMKYYNPSISDIAKQI